MINGYFWFVLVAVVGIYWLDLVSDLLNVSALRPDLPEEFSEVYDVEKYAESQKYTRVTTRADLIRSTFALLVFSGLLVCGWLWLAR